MPRLSRATRLSSALALAVCSVGLGASAGATDIPTAITEVRIDEDTAYTWSQFRLHLDWTVPDGSAPGDTFTLELPPELQATDGRRFALRDDDDEVVADAVIEGRRVTFTLTDYVSDHVGVRGSAWFWVRFTDVVQPGDDLDLEFRSEGRVVPGDTTISVGVPTATDGSAAAKWQSWQVAGERLLWAVDGPVVSENMVGATYEIRDTPGPGQAIDCDDIHVFTGTRDGSWVRTGYIVKNRLESYDCSADAVSMTIRPTADQVGTAFRLLGQSDVTDPSLAEYTNSGYVRIWGTSDWTVTHRIEAGAGGVGEGQTPTDPGATPTDPTEEPTDPGEPTDPTDEPTEPAEPTDPTDEPTDPTVPGEPTDPADPTDEPTDDPTSPGESPTGEPTPTVTVTVPSTPGPTVTVPVPGPVQTVPVPGPTVTVTTPPTVAPGQPVGGTTAPVPTQTSPGEDPTVVVPAVPVPTTTAPATTSTPTPALPAVPAATVTVPAQTPAPTVTVTAAPPVAGGAPTGGTTPTRIDSGVPEQGVDARLVGAGGAIALASGFGLLALSRRRPSAARD